MPNDERDEPLMAIGRIGAPKGVRGDLKINSYSGEYAHFLKLKTALLEGELPAAAASNPAPSPLRMSAASRKLVASAAGPAPAAAKRRLTLRILRAQVTDGGLSMAFEGYESPEEARKLTGMDILVTRDEAAPLRDNEWYVSDLIGLALVAGGERLATVVSVLEGGPELWLEARLLPGSRGSEGTASRDSGRVAVVPFRKEFVGEVSLEAGEIELIAPWILE